MPYIAIDDGHPEAPEYQDRDLWYDAGDPGSLRRAVEHAHRKLADRRRNAKDRPLRAPRPS